MKRVIRSSVVESGKVLDALKKLGSKFEKYLMGQNKPGKYVMRGTRNDGAKLVEWSFLDEENGEVIVKITGKYEPKSRNGDEIETWDVTYKTADGATHPDYIDEDIRNEINEMSDKAQLACYYLDEDYQAYMDEWMSQNGESDESFDESEEAL